MSLMKRLNITDRSWSSCKYTVEVELIFSDGTIRTLRSLQITGLYMEKDYDNDHFPIIIIDLALTSIDEDNVDDQTIFHVKIKQFYLEGNDETAEKKSQKIFLDENFIRIGYGTNPSTSETLEQRIRDDNGLTDDQVAPSDLTSQTSYVLIKKSDFVMSKTIVNAIPCNETQQNIVGWLLSEANVGRRVLMSNFTNTTVRSELLLQPRTLIEQLIFLEQEYGWYTEGAYIFIDYDIIYIIRKNGKPTAWKKNDSKNVCFNITGSNSSSAMISGVIEQNNIIYVNVGPDDFNLIDSSLVEDQISGTNLILINTTTGESTKVITETNSLDGNGAYTTKMHHGHNPYVASQYKRMKNENDHIWQIKCMDADLSYFTPQRQFTFLSDVTKINNTLRGIYRISIMQTNFIKTGRFFNTTTTLRVKRTSLT